MKLLPVLCLLLTLSGPASADGNSPAHSVTVKEDQDAVLPCSLSPPQNIESKFFNWKKDEKNGNSKEVFHYHNGEHYNNRKKGQDEQFKDRVFHFQDQLKDGNASIIIKSTTLKDNGDYTCDFQPLTPEAKTFHIKLVVGASPKPYVRSVKQTKDSTLLQCDVGGAFPKPTVELQDSSGNKLPAKKTEDSEREGRFYITLQTTVTKTDNYSCVATQETLNHRTSAATDVHIGGPTVVDVEEGSNIVLPCSLNTNENIELKHFDWKKDGQKEVFSYDAGRHDNKAQDEQFKDRVKHFPDKLKNGVASINIRNTKMSDSGNYICDFPNLQPRQIFHIKLDVFAGDGGSGGSAAGSATGWIIAVVVLGILLFCVGVIATVLKSKGYTLNRNKDDDKKNEPLPVPTDEENLHYGSEE